MVTAFLNSLSIEINMKWIVIFWKGHDNRGALINFSQSTKTIDEDPLHYLSRKRGTEVDVVEVLTPAHIWSFVEQEQLPDGHDAFLVTSHDKTRVNGILHVTNCRI